MHVALTVNFSPWSRYSGGGQRSAHQLAGALSELGHDVSVVYTKALAERVLPPGRLPYEVQWASFPAIRSASRATLRILSAYAVRRRLTALAEQRHVDVIHSQGEEGALCTGLSHGISRPLVVVTPRYPAYPERLRSNPTHLSHRLARWTVPVKFHALGHLIRHADVCCPTSASSAAKIVSAFGTPREMAIVPNGVSESFLSVERKPTACRGPLLFFGRLETAKGVDVLLKSYAQIKGDKPPLWIVGRGRAENNLRAWTERQGLSNQVRFHGWLPTDALCTLLAETRVAVLPSREESFGNAMVEAMATSTPLISTTAGSIPEVVAHGETGLLVPPSSVSELTDAMEKLLRAPRLAHALGQRAKKHVEETFSWRSTARAFEDLYRNHLHRVNTSTNP